MTSANIRVPLIQIQYQASPSSNIDVLYQSPNSQLTSLRMANLNTYQSGNIVVICDDTVNAILTAALGIGRTIFVCIVLTMSSVYFTKDSNDLVVRPIEIMLEKVKKISNNPLEAAQIEEQEAFLKDQLEDNQANNQLKILQLKKKEEQSTYETSILEKTIIKIGGLLALGFGEAGSGIIAANMAAGGDVNPMLPGKKTMGVFGFCNIRNFTDATEILQEDVMVFVNEIADITHGIVDQFCGAANKNIGDAFLLVWKYNDNMVTNNHLGNPILITSLQSKQFTDLALLAFIKIVAAISLSNTLKKYKKHVKLNERMPNYSVKMGFGLHCGFGIEGSIGSIYKIDASYLSPNVNMASRLEGATKSYGVPILISEQMISAMTEKCAKECRKIDTVTVKGMQDPLNLYCIDLDLQNLEHCIKVADIDKHKKDNMSRLEKKTLKFKSRMKRDNFRKDVIENNIDLHQNFFKEDQEIIVMRETFSQKFKDTFQTGLEYYTQGDFEQAKQIFLQVHKLHPQRKDGPSDTLLNVMQEFAWKAPPNWKGTRDFQG